MTIRYEPFDTSEARLIDALFRGDGDAAVAEFGGTPILDANIAGRIEGDSALRELAERWHRIFNLDQPGPISFRAVSASGNLSMTEVQVLVPTPEGSAVLPVGIVGVYRDEDRSAGTLERAHVYFYEKVLNGSADVRPPSYDTSGDDVPISADQLNGINAAYYDAVTRLDLEGVLATFAPDATIEVGTSVIPPDQVRRLYEQFIGDEVVLYFSSQIHEPRSFTVEWTSGHLEPAASGMGIYLFDDEGRIKSIRMYDHFDPATVEGLRLEPIRMGDPNDD
ncbi:MAG TPA: hypothetical protein VNQ52_03280 [Microbacteriaceae bacterium]|nr:hypothetical protein [Microbacteriaceae bacterium]